MRKIWGLKIKRVQVFSSKKLKQNITNVLFLLFMFSSLLLSFCCLKEICIPSICISNDIKIVINLVKNKILKFAMVLKLVFNVGWF